MYNIFGKPAYIISIVIIMTLSVTLRANAQSTTLTVTRNDVINLINNVNQKWQKNNSYSVSSFWHNAAYHTGNMEAYKITGLEEYRKYSENWAIHNNWKGATSTNKAEWKYSYGETSKYVLFGDWQICFQTYADLYNLDTAYYKIARAREVIEYEMNTSNVDYWWWADGLYMVMPVMTKLYKITGNKLYLEKFAQYFAYADKLMYDNEYKLYYRDAKYVYPLRPTTNGKKNFWSRGNGWVFAGFAKILQDLPEGEFRDFIIERYKGMAKTLIETQQDEGYWVRSILDPEHAPERETSGTAFFTYGLLWGINNGILDKITFLPCAIKAWNYLQNIAIQPNYSVGYIQPIGEQAIPNQTVSAASTSNFGVGAFLLAACEFSRYLDQVNSSQKNEQDVLKGFASHSSCTPK